MAPSCALPLVFGLLLLLLPASDASLLELRSGGEKVSSPEEVVRLLKDHAITGLTLYDADHSMLRALGNSSILVIVGIHNPDEVEDLARDSENARVWVAKNIVPFVEDTNVTAIAVGDEGSFPLTVQAMRNLRHALAGAKLGHLIEVASPRAVSEPSYASLTPDQEQGFLLSLNEDLAKRRRWLADERGFVWCVVREPSQVDVNAVQAALNWTCDRINCSPTRVGGRCFLPDTIWDHASWAFNAYFNSRNGALDSCNFSGTAYVTSNNPSSQQCFYQGTNRVLVDSTACTQHGQTAVLTLAVSLMAVMLVLVVL